MKTRADHSGQPTLLDDARQVFALNLAVELGHDPVELFERAAQTLTVLLRNRGSARA